MEIKLKGEKSATVRALIFSMLDVLRDVGIPLEASHRRLERMAMACMAIGGISEAFAQARSSDSGKFLTTREIIGFINRNFQENMSPGSYDDIRRQDLLLLVEAGIAVSSSSIDSQATNNPKRGYALNPQFVRLLKSCSSSRWRKELAAYKAHRQSLAEELQRKREMEKIPVKLPSGVALKLSAGEHNVLQKAVIEEFLPRFGMNAEVLYLGDTSDKLLFLNQERLTEIGFFALSHDELPDVVAYSAEKNIVFLIEAVHSAGPMSEIRVRKLSKQLDGCLAIPVFVTAFIDKKSFRKWAADIAWETEAWIADNPQHMIHFNGYKFLEIHR